MRKMLLVALCALSSVSINSMSKSKPLTDSDIEGPIVHTIWNALSCLTTPPLVFRYYTFLSPAERKGKITSDQSDEILKGAAIDMKIRAATGCALGACAAGALAAGQPVAAQYLCAGATATCASSFIPYDFSGTSYDVEQPRVEPESSRSGWCGNPKED